MRAVELRPEVDGTEPSQLTSGFAAEAFGGVVHGFSSPTRGVSLGHGFPGPTDAMPGIGLPVAEVPADGEWCGRHLWVPGASSSTARATPSSKVLRAHAEAIPRDKDALAE